LKGLGFSDAPLTLPIRGTGKEEVRGSPSQHTASLSRMGLCQAIAAR